MNSFDWYPQVCQQSGDMLGHILIYVARNPNSLRKPPTEKDQEIYLEMYESSNLFEGIPSFISKLVE